MLENQTNTWYYKISYFFIANQVFFKRLLVVLLILINIIIWWNGGVKIGNYLTGYMAHKKTMEGLTKNYIDWQTIHKTNKPSQPIIYPVNILKDGNKYNFVVKIFNPNDNWEIKEYNYAFLVDEHLLEKKSEFILPKQEKYLTSFSYKSSLPPNNVTLKLIGIKWKKIKNKDLNKLKIIDNIVIDKKEFKITKGITQLKFNILNNTYFNFWKIGWQIALYKNNKLYAFNYTISNTFLSGDKRNISVTWLKELTPPTKIEIIPEIDVLDASNYIDSNRPTVNLIKGVRTQK